MLHGVHKEKFLQDVTAKLTFKNGVEVKPRKKRQRIVEAHIPKLPIRKFNYTDIRMCSKEGSYQCSCKKCNHFQKVSFETAKHYRQLFWLKGPLNADDLLGAKRASRYNRRMILWEMLKDIYECNISFKRATHRTFNPKKFNFDQCSYFIRDVETGRKLYLCMDAFRQVLGISQQLLVEVRNLVVSGREPKMDVAAQAALRKKRESGEWLAVVTFITQLEEELSNKSPDCKRSEVPFGHKNDYYRMFVEDWKVLVKIGAYNRTSKTGDPFRPPSRSLFYKVWREEFGCLKVPKHQNRFAKCDWCVTLKNNINTCIQSREHDRAVFWRLRLFEHYKYIALQRRVYHETRRGAALRPGE